MRYEEFKQVWIEARREAQLPLLSAWEGSETLDTLSLDRTFETHLGPFAGQDAEPFHVCATLSWGWTALLTARMATTEEDMLGQVLPRDNMRRVKTERPTVRVDVSLTASLPYGKPIPMPTPATWARWCREVGGRLKSVEPLIPEQDTREGLSGRREILAWQQAPVARFVCGDGGELKLEKVEVAAGQIIDLPRQWNDPARKVDEHPDRQVRELFARLRPAMHAWMEALDHLSPKGGRSQ